MDGRKNNGGARKGAGRKPKAEEEHVRRLGLDAIKNVYGSVEKYYQHIARESIDSFSHLKLLQEYVFGKPKETIVVENDNDDDFDYSQLSDKTLKEIAGLTDKPKQS
jgi:hypothetical protein